MLERHGITPRQADLMTLAEIALAIDEPGARPHDGRGMQQSGLEVLHELAAWQAMTPKQRLQLRMDRA